MADLKTFTSKLRIQRLWIQAAFLLIWLDPFAMRLHNICGPVFHCYACPLSLFACPVGVMANFSALHLFPFLAVGTLLIIGSITGGLICGFVCPFGLLQDLAYKIPAIKINAPAWLSYARYAVLAFFVLAIPFIFDDSHSLFFCKICPAGAIESSIPNMLSQAWANQPVLWPNPLKITITAAVLIGMVVIYRFWCRLCPLGAVFGLFNRISILFLKFNPDSCTACQICHKNCKLAISPAKDSNNHNCIRCLDCTSCKPGALELGLPVNDRQDPDQKS